VIYLAKVISQSFSINSLIFNFRIQQYFNKSLCLLAVSAFQNSLARFCQVREGAQSVRWKRQFHKIVFIFHCQILSPFFTLHLWCRYGLLLGGWDDICEINLEKFEKKVRKSLKKFDISEFLFFYKWIFSK